MNKKAATLFVVIIIVLCISIVVNYASNNSLTALSATFKIFVRGIEYKGDNLPVVIGGRTYLPLRGIGESLGVDVHWNEELRRVEVDMSGDKSKVELSEFDPLILKIDNITSKSGNEIEVPIHLDNLPQGGLHKCDFELLYDKDIFNIVTVKSGSIVSGNESSFSFNIENGIIKILFDPSFKGGGKYIGSNGHFATITIKISDNAKKGKNPIRLIHGGYFEDQHFKALSISYNIGSIIVQ